MKRELKNFEHVDMVETANGGVVIRLMAPGVAGEGNIVT